MTEQKYRHLQTGMIATRTIWIESYDEEELKERGLTGEQAFEADWRMFEEYHEMKRWVIITGVMGSRHADTTELKMATSNGIGAIVADKEQGGAQWCVAVEMNDGELEEQAYRRGLAKALDTDRDIIRKREQR